MSWCFNCFQIIPAETTRCPYCKSQVIKHPMESFQLYPGTNLKNRYMVGTVIGWGGMGITYVAWDFARNEKILIKEYFPFEYANRIQGNANVFLYSDERTVGFQNGKKYFWNVNQKLMEFNKNPNIVHILDLFEENNTAYLVKEFIDDITYRQVIKNSGGKVSVNYAVDVTKAVLNALREIHKAGILHLDIQPDNISIDKGNKVRLRDFEASVDRRINRKESLSIIVVPGYAPPEQYISKKNMGYWTDIYAVGATMYYAVTGIKPQEATERMVKDTLEEPRRINSDIPEKINHIIMKAMKLNYKYRYQTVDEFENDLLAENINNKKSFKSRISNAFKGSGCI